MVTSSLMRDDPYHIPGYRGYVPQFKFQIGGTYGETTHNIMNTVEAAIPKDIPLPHRIIKEKPQLEALKRRASCTDDEWHKTKLTGTMVPGYTGYIPRGQQYFGQRYTSTCRSAIQNFEDDLLVKQNDEHKFRMIPRKPLVPVSQQEKYPQEIKDFPYGTSPYRLPVGHSDRYFISGYTGFLPRAQELIARTYPEISTGALNLHKADQDRVRGAPRQNIIIMNRARTAPPKIYASDSGLIPHYTGHVPTMKYKFGRTFGATTQNVLNKSV